MALSDWSVGWPHSQEVTEWVGQEEAGLILCVCVCVCVWSEWPVQPLVLGQDVLGASELLPQVGHLPPQSRVLLFQEAGSDGDLVLFEPPSVPGPLRRKVVLPAAGPVFVILLEEGQVIVVNLTCYIFSVKRD